MSRLKTLTINGTTYKVTSVVPTTGVTLMADSWEGSGDTYSQVVDLSDVTANTKVDLQPTPEQLAEFHYKSLGFVAVNDNGVVTVYAIGDKPKNDHTIQVTLTEVVASGPIRGNTVGTTMPRPDMAQTDPNKADYVRNKPMINGVELIGDKSFKDLGMEKVLLPMPTTADNDKILQVVAGRWVAVEADLGGDAPALPIVSTADNGHMLQVVNGVWAAVDPTPLVETVVNSVLEEALGGEY